MSNVLNCDLDFVLCSLCGTYEVGCHHVVHPRDGVALRDGATAIFVIYAGRPGGVAVNLVEASTASVRSPGSNLFLKGIHFLGHAARLH